MSNNEFITRGCSCTPKPFQPNDKIFDHGCNKLNAYDWLNKIELPKGIKPFNVIEVRFKNCRKDFFKVPDDLSLTMGEIVAVEASPGHDIGIVSLTGELVKIQMRKRKLNPYADDIKKVYRKAKPYDIEKWNSAVEIENLTMHKARKIAHELKLVMKISDVEYQGDKTKAIFYYTAEERVDFRELIKLLAEEFSIRIEMRQIGVRQEASRLGGIGSCGRELCCSTWISDFKSVSTNSARYQQLSLNPQKLAGQCSKLKCCLNFELDCYIDALKNFPDTDVVLKTKKGDAIHQKTDVFKEIIWYSYTYAPEHFIPMSLENVKKNIELNSQGILPAELEAIKEQKVANKDEYQFQVQDEYDINRFDKYTDD